MNIISTVNHVNYMYSVCPCLFSDLPTFDPVDDVYGAAAEEMADASLEDDEDIPDTGTDLYRIRTGNWA